jgi:hypothetical protein
MLRLVNSAVFRPGLADVEAQALWIRGRSFLGRGAADVALASLSQAIDLMDKVVDRTVSVELGSMLGSLALAQFRAGDTGAARLAFNRMKSIFDRHLTLGRPLRDELTAIGKELGIRS